MYFAGDLDSLGTPRRQQSPRVIEPYPSNTYWDWNLNHVGQVYGVMDEVFGFVATFKEFPPRSFPPSFVPATIMEETIDGIKDARREAGGKR